MTLDARHWAPRTRDYKQIRPSGIAGPFNGHHDDRPCTEPTSTTGGCPISGIDKTQNKAEALKGKAKEALGDATDNEHWQAEGKADQVKGNLKQAAEKVKDAVKNVVEHQLLSCLQAD